MSSENDLKNEIKENQQYINELLSKQDQQVDRLRYMEEFANTQSVIIDGLKKKVVKYTKLYAESLNKIDSLESEKKENVDEVWQLRGENKLLKQRLDLQNQKFSEQVKNVEIGAVTKDEAVEKLQKENTDLKTQINIVTKTKAEGESTNNLLLMEQIASLRNELRELKEQQNRQETCNSGRDFVDKLNETSSENFDFPEDDTNILLNSASQPRVVANKKVARLSKHGHEHDRLFLQNDLLNQPTSLFSSTSDAKPNAKEEPDIEELEKVLQKYKSRFDEEDAKKKRVEDIFTLFDVVKRRLSSEIIYENDSEQKSGLGNRAAAQTVPNSEKYEQLENKIDQISNNLKSLMQQKNRVAPSQKFVNNNRKSSSDQKKKSFSSSQVNTPKLNLNDVSLDESQIDILHRNVGETTQKKYTLGNYQEHSVGSKQTITSNDNKNESSDTVLEGSPIGMRSTMAPSVSKTQTPSDSPCGDRNGTELRRKHSSDSDLDTLERIVKDNRSVAIDVDDIVARYS